MSDEILNQLAADMNKLLTEPIGSRSVKITDLTPRDGQQCKLATRVTTDDLLPLCASIDNCGFYAVEVWGGATFDVCMRYLREDPWDRLRRIKSVMPKTKLQMLLRGQHILAYRPYTDKIVCKFVERAIANGMNVFRIFEATNDFRNIETATKAVKELGGEAHVEVNYTVSPVHTLEKWMEYAEQLIEVGADWLSLKDATGIMTPFDSYRIIKGIKDRAKGKLPVLLHCHDMGGTSSMCHLMAILAGVDMIKEKYEKYETGYTGVSADVFIHKVPGGMISNMVAQLKEAKRMDLMEAALKETPSVEKDLGHPPLLTPTSQIVGVQAVLNVLAGERYKIVSRETSDYVKGKYGRPPGPVNKELIKKIMKDKEPDYSLRSSELADPSDWDKAAKDLGPLAKSDEDLLLGVLFPMQAKEFLTLRESGGLQQ
jgi:2-oxoglutarate carboxylase large subunit